MEEFLENENQEMNGNEAKYEIQNVIDQI